MQHDTPTPPPFEDGLPQELWFSVDVECSGQTPLDGSLISIGACLVDDPAVSFYIEFGGIFNDRMDMKFDPSGALTIYGGTHSHGQGHATVFAQIAHDMLGVPYENIRYVQGDTDKVPFGRGSFAARASLVGGAALREASIAMIEKAKLMAAHLMEAAATDIEFKDGKQVEKIVKYKPYDWEERKRMYMKYMLIYIFQW